MKCRLTRLNSVHRNLRTDEVVGICPFKPRVGVPFMLSGKPLNPNAHVRLVETTKIIKATPSEEGKVIEFETENSVYKWEHLIDPDSSAG